MNKVELPALAGDSPLSILAAVGVLRLLSEFSEQETKLCWSVNTLTATICGPYEDVGVVITALQMIAKGISTGSVLPGVGRGFPPPGAAPDKLRAPQHDFRSMSADLLTGMSPAEQHSASLWLASLVTDLAVDDKGRVAISQYTAPSGKQSMATMLTKPLEQVQDNPDYLRQALTGWRRVSGVTGEYLDNRAMWDATEDGGGSASMRGVPGATWLALMSYPIFRTTVSPRKRALSSGWHTAGAKGTRTYDELRLPVWGQPIGINAVTALVEHPALAKPTGTGKDLEALGILHVCRARRYQPAGSKSAGVLTPVR